MTPSSEANRWLIQAQDEYGDAQELRLRGRFYLALFLFQQSAEKALKAYLHRETGSRRALHLHSVYELAEMASEVDPEFATIKHAAKLDTYYIPTRYPNGLPGGVPSRYYADPEEARVAGEMAGQVLALVERKLAQSQEGEL